MNLFPAEFSAKVSKYINGLNEELKKRIKQKIDKLEQDPFPQDVERVVDYKDEKVFRVRVGNQRILYIVRYNPNKIIIAAIDKRSRVYER